MSDYVKKEHSDCREASWPQGLYRRGDSFRYRRLSGSQRIIEVWGDMPEGDAIGKTNRYNYDLECGRNPIEECVKKEMTVAEFAREIWFPKKATELRPRSLARYKAVTELFISYLENIKGMPSALLSSIGYDVASDYIAYRATAPLMPNGQKKFTRIMRHGASKKTVVFDRETLFQLFKEAVKRDLIKKNPFADVHPKKPTIHEVRAVHHPLTIDEEAALLRAAAKIDELRPDKGNPSFYDIVLFLVKTGLRDDEMCWCEYSDIDFREGLIHVRLKKVEETRQLPIPRNAVAGLRKRIARKSANDPVFKDKQDIASFGVMLDIRSVPELLALKVGEVDLINLKITTRRTCEWKPKGTNGVVPMCKAVRSLLERLAENKTSNFVFPHKDGGPCRMKLLPLLKKAQKMAGIKGRLRTHDLRHTLGRRLRKDKGVPLETIMGILRHADIRETMIYAPYSLEEGRDAMGRLDDDAISAKLIDR
jgi:integrase